MLLREKLVQAELAAAKLGIHEVGGDNHGPMVKKFLAEVGLPEGYAWCDGFQSYEEHAAAGRKLPIESASVAYTYSTAKRLGWLVGAPARGDLVLYDFDGDGQTDDHIGCVVQVVKRGPVFTLKTVEGNTSSGVGGSQANGDGVYVRTRVVSARSVAFIRIPGVVPGASPSRTKKPVAKPAPLPALRKGAKGPNVRRLQTLLEKSGAKIAVDGVFGASTLNSLRAFQRRNHLAVDGVCGPKTWSALKGGTK